MYPTFFFLIAENTEFICFLDVPGFLKRVPEMVKMATEREGRKGLPSGFGQRKF